MMNRCFLVSQHESPIKIIQTEDFILVVLLVSFLQVPEWCQHNLDIIDLFSGKARISKLASWMGYKCRAFDLTYHPVRHPYKRKRGRLPRSCMDLNGCAGLAIFASKKQILGCLLFTVFLIGAGPQKKIKKRFHTSTNRLPQGWLWLYA